MLPEQVVQLHWAWYSEHTQEKQGLPYKHRCHSLINKLSNYFYCLSFIASPSLNGNNKTTSHKIDYVVQLSDILIPRGIRNIFICSKITVMLPDLVVELHWVWYSEQCINSIANIVSTLRGSRGCPKNTIVIH